MDMHRTSTVSYVASHTMLRLNSTNQNDISECTNLLLITEIAGSTSTCYECTLIGTKRGDPVCVIKITSVMIHVDSM